MVKAADSRKRERSTCRSIKLDIKGLLCARLSEKYLLDLPCRHMLPWWWVVFGVVTGKLTYYWALQLCCVRAVQKRLLRLLWGLHY